jgi:hypothetical protein
MPKPTRRHLHGPVLHKKNQKFLTGGSMAHGMLVSQWVKVSKQGIVSFGFFRFSVVSYAFFIFRNKAYTSKSGLKRRTQGAIQLVTAESHMLPICILDDLNDHIKCGFKDRIEFTDAMEAVLDCVCRCCLHPGCFATSELQAYYGRCIFTFLF